MRNYLRRSVYLSIAEAAALIRSKQLSSIELTEAVLKRMDQVELKVHAFITIVREEAMQAAKAAEKEIMAGKYRGPLHGIPVGVKDTHYTKGIRTTAATPVLADFVPPFDATVVSRLKRAGAILMGKTNLPEFSFGGATPGTNNPWDLSRTPGARAEGLLLRSPQESSSAPRAATHRARSGGRQFCVVWWE